MKNIFFLLTLICAFTFMANAQVLTPVVTEFGVGVDQDGNTLSWYIAPDATMTYALERAEAGTTDFELIATVDTPEKAETGVAATYLYFDPYLNDVWYRLKWLDAATGAFEYSDIIEANRTGNSYQVHKGNGGTMIGEIVKPPSNIIYND